MVASFFFLLFFLGNPVNADDETVISIKKNKYFKTFLSDHELSLIEFYAPWCGHCKQLAPEYEEAAKELKGQIPLAKVDCTSTNGRPICDQHGVQGFPTLKIFRDGKPSDYNGGRTADDIVKYMKKQMAPAVSVLNSADDLTTLKTLGDLTVIGSFESLEGDEYSAFEKIAKANRDDYAFGASTQLSSVVEEGINVPEGSSVVLLKTFDEGHNIYTGEMDSTAVLAFLKKNSFPLVGEINQETYGKYSERGLPMVYFFVDPSKIEEAAAVKAVAKEVAADHKGVLSLVTLDGVQWDRFMEGTFGVRTIPDMAVQNKRDVHRFSGDVNKVDDVKQFLVDYLAGKIEKYLKSQEPPADNSGPVKVVVGKTFDEIVKDTTKDVLVEFYAPWCGHCKKLAPIYEQLGEHYQNDKNIVIAKCDATENDTPAEIEGFPTLLFYPTNNKEGLKFEGNRELADMKKYVEEHRTTQAEAPQQGHEEL